MSNLNHEALLRQLSQDRALASAVLFARRHPQASPPFHIQIVDLWRAADPYVAIGAFREGAKTTLSEEFMAMELLFANSWYTLIFGETYTKACQRIEALKYEITNNDKIIELFGKQKGAIWSENKIILKNGRCIEAHGWEEEIRGYKYLDFRPDRALLDDIENKERVRDTATVDANWKKLHLELIPAIDTLNGKVRLTGTPLAEDCMLTRAANSSNWTYGHFPICSPSVDDPEAVALWPERYPMEWIRAKRDQYSNEGMLKEFNQEYMLIAAGAMGKPFTDDMLRFEDVAPGGYRPRKGIMDPARTADIKTSDQTGHVVVSKVASRIYVHESQGQYLQPDEVVNELFAISERHDEAEMCVEKNSLDNWLLQPIRTKSLTTGKQLKLRVINAPQDRDKEQFILGLQPFFKAGDIIFVGGRAKHQQLISQILNFPAGKRDILNALAYTLRIYAGVPIYPDFGQHNIMPAPVIDHKTRLLLAVNATQTETAAVLCALNGKFLTVLADWVSPLTPNDAVPDIAMLIRGVYPGHGIACWVPGQVYDQVGRNPVVAALKSAHYNPNRGDTNDMTRGSLSPMLRTQVGNRRLLMVSEEARETLAALSEGYYWPTKLTGERAPEPERNSARTLIEALETLTFALAKADTPATLKTNAVNATGTPYLSALPGRRGR